MAKVNNDDSPLVNLTPLSKKNLDEIEAELNRASDDLDAIEGLGIDVSRLRQQVDWGRKARETILKRLT